MATQSPEPETQAATSDRSWSGMAAGGAGRRRRLWRAAAVTGLVIALLVVSAYVYLRVSSTVAETGAADCADVPVGSVAGFSEAADTAAICEVISELETAWATNDAEAYGAPFTAEATYTTYAGTHYVGQSEIIASHAALFGDVLEDSRLDNSYLALRPLTQDVAILTTRGDTYEGENPGEPSKVQTYTFVSEADDWKIAAFHNTQRQPVMERIQYLWMPETRPAAER